MYEYAITYDSPEFGEMVVDYCRADSDKGALAFARFMFTGGSRITVERV